MMKRDLADMGLILAAMLLLGVYLHVLAVIGS